MACGDYYQKQIFQNTLFPRGVVQDMKIEHYPTDKINSIIELTSQLSNNSWEIKTPDFSYLKIRPSYHKKNPDNLARVLNGNSLILFYNYFLSKRPFIRIYFNKINTRIRNH